ncbi:Transient receptor potential cation channel subfamily 5 member 6, partial [Danaus plexippus plexippus]
SMYLVASESSAVESDAPLEDQASSGNNSTIRGRQDDSLRAVRPLCIQQATALISPAAQNEHLMFIKESGNGAEVEGPAPVRKVKVTTKTRPKTAKARRNR